MRRYAVALAAIATIVMPSLAALPAVAQQAADTTAPEAATGTGKRKAVVARRHMVAAANPIAVDAGLAVLREGGSAADALVAVQAMLGLVEPQSSGIGGGAFLVWYDAASRTVTSFDGRETAPASATPDLFLGPDGKPLEFFAAVVGGRSVGVPGVVRLMADVHERYGKREWPELFSEATAAAENGFAVSPRLAALIADDKDLLGREPTTKPVFFDSAGEPLKVGALFKNPAYAATLRAIAEGGADAFYTGPIADAIIAAVQGHATNPGGLTKDDLTGYAVKQRDAVCAPYRGHEVCGMGPPSSGAPTIGQILGLVSGFDLATLGPDDPESWRIIGEATRLAFADRERYLADPDFVDIPKGYLNPDYLNERAALIRRPTALGKDEVKAGEPPRDRAELRIDGVSFEQPATSHFVVVDDDGNIASMTTSIENGFGARLMAGGFLLNNQLTDFSFAPEKDGVLVANRVEPKKRPRSSMSPTIILKDGKPVAALGSPGGSTIIPYVANTIIALIDWKMDIQQAIDLPHLANRFGRYDLEVGTKAEELADDLTALGYEVKAVEMNSGLHGVTFGPDGITGGADPRREGIAAGD